MMRKSLVFCNLVGESNDDRDHNVADDVDDDLNDDRDHDGEDGLDDQDGQDDGDVIHLV